MVRDYPMFDKVYDKLVNAIELKIKHIYNLHQIGSKIDYNAIKVLNIYINYLESIKYNRYRYFYIEGLTNISNYINKL